MAGLPLPPIRVDPILSWTIAGGMIGVALFARWLKKRKKRPDARVAVIDPGRGVFKKLDARRVSNILVSHDDDQVIVTVVPPEVKPLVDDDGMPVYPVIVVGELGFPGNPEDFIAMSVLSLADSSDSVEEFIRSVSEIVSRELRVNVAGVKVALPFSLSKSLRQYIAYTNRNVAVAFSALRALSANMEYLKQYAEATERIARARERLINTIVLGAIILLIGIAIFISAVK